MASGSDDQPIDVSSKIKILDGDIRSQIKRDSRIFPELVVLYRFNRIKMHPVYNAHMAFLKAGSNLIRTNTYHALFPYVESRLQVKSEKYYTRTIRNAVYLAIQSVAVYCIKNKIPESSLSIVGSCGCFIDKIIDSLSSDELKNAHRQRIRILLASGVDMLSLEGIRNIEEANMLFDLMREFPNTKSLVMFDGGQNLHRLATRIPEFYTKYGSQITAIGLNNIYDNDDGAKIFCEEMIKGRKTENLIPLVMCTPKFDNIPWNPIAVNSDAPVIEWEKFGLRYIGDVLNVDSEDIAFLREKLNSNNIS